MSFKEILTISLQTETERLHRPLSILMPDEYRLDNALRQQLSSGCYQFPDVQATGTDKLTLVRTQSFFSSKIHVPGTPLYFHRHDFVELLYMYRGHCIQYLENLSECLSLKEGDFFLLGPGVTHGLLQQEENAVLIKTIIPLGYLGSEFVQRLQGQQAMFWADALSSRPEQAHCLSYCDSTEDERLFMERMMTTYYSKKEFRDDCCRCWLQLLLISLEHRQGICRKYRLSYGGMEIGRMIQYIYEHSENVTLEQLADFFSYSPSYLSRAIKEGCGMTFLNLLRECRLEKAAMLLSSSRLTIEEIAAQVGYKNTTSVYEGIKLKFGISPGEYRSKYGQSNGPQTANK